LLVPTAIASKLLSTAMAAMKPFGSSLPFTQDKLTNKSSRLSSSAVLDNRYDDRIVVWRVIPRRPLLRGIREGDVISTFDGRPYKTRTEFEKSVGDWRTGELRCKYAR